MVEALSVVGAVIIRDGRVLACRRSADKPAAGLWEFPGGKVEPRESPQQALARELEEELGLVDVSVGRLICRETTSVPGSPAIDLACYLVHSEQTSNESSDHDAFHWCAVDELSELEWAEPDLPTVTRLVLDGLGEPEEQ